MAADRKDTHQRCKRADYGFTEEVGVPLRPHLIPKQDKTCKIKTPEGSDQPVRPNVLIQCDSKGHQSSVGCLRNIIFQAILSLSCFFIFCLVL